MSQIGPSLLGFAAGFANYLISSGQYSLSSAAFFNCNDGSVNTANLNITDFSLTVSSCSAILSITGTFTAPCTGYLQTVDVQAAFNVPNPPSGAPGQVIADLNIADIGANVVGGQNYTIYITDVANFAQTTS